MNYFRINRCCVGLLIWLVFQLSGLGELSLCGQDAQQELGELERPSNLINADLDLVHEHDPAVELANFDLLDGYEVNLFATDPMLANPVHMTWGPDGKLYVACSWAYPQLKPGEKANDKIIVLEDTDGDGRADQSTVFADGLYLPTGLELANGGVYVAQSPHILFLKDTDGDGQADHREIALTGFGIEDSHHTNSAWRRGPGGWIYFQEGIFLHTQVETQFGTVRNYNGGVYQFNPRTGELRVFANINVGNPWGHVFDEWGQSFLVDNPRISYLTPSTGYQSEKRKPFVLTSTEKQCGGDLVSSTHLPTDIQGQLLSCRFKSRTIIRYEFGEDRSGFTANVLEPLMSSRHPNFRPVDVKIGPDGAIYVADWYNSIINHAGQDFRDPRRDFEHGRIWRITAKDRPLVKKPNIVGRPLSDLLEHLKSPNAWTRHYARKEISERNPDEVAVAVAGWVETLDPSDPRLEHHLIESLWTLQNVERFNESILQRAMKAESGHARAAASRLIRYWHSELSNPVALLQQAANDPFPRVRLEAVLSAGFVPDGQALVAAMQAIDHPLDPFIESALDQTVSALADRITPDLAFSKPEHAAYARNLGGVGIESRLNELLKSGSGTASELQTVFSSLLRRTDGKSVNQMTKALINRADKLDPALSIAVLETLSKLGRRGEKVSAKQVAKLTGLLDGRVPELVIPTLDLVAACQIKSASSRVVELLVDTDQSVKVRIAAARSLGELETPEGLAALNQSASDNNRPVERAIAVYGLVVNQPEIAAPVAAELLADENPEVDPVELINAFIERRKGVNLLGRALGKNRPHPTVSANVSEHFKRTGKLPESLARHFRPKLNTRLVSELTKSDLDTLAAEVDVKGDARRGELIYRRKELACSSCHGIAQVGPQVGPDLAAVGAAANTSYMVDSILRPNKAIAEHYETTVVITIDGQLQTGIITFQNERELVLRDPGKSEPIKIDKADIEAQKQGASLMPTGLVENLNNKQEFLDLAKFLSQLGRPGPYQTTTKPVIRLWRVLADPRPATELDIEAIEPDGDWRSAYSLVRGELPSNEFSEARSAWVRAAINVQQAGKIKLQLNSSDGIRVWLDDQELKDLDASIELDVGRRLLTILVDNQSRGDVGLRVEIVDSATNRARYQMEQGQ